MALTLTYIQSFTRHVMQTLVHKSNMSLPSITYSLNICFAYVSFIAIQSRLNTRGKYQSHFSLGCHRFQWIWVSDALDRKSIGLPEISDIQATWQGWGNDFVVETQRVARVTTPQRMTSPGRHHDDPARKQRTEVTPMTLVLRDETGRKIGIVADDCLLPKRWQAIYY